MTDRDLEQQLRAWYRTDAGVDVAPPELRHRVLAIPHSIPTRGHALSGRRGLTLLAAAMLLVGGALAAGSGLLRLPSIIHQDTPAPSEADRTSPRPSPPTPSTGPRQPTEIVQTAPLSQGQLNTVHEFLLATDRIGWASTNAGILRTEDTGSTWHDVSPAGWTATAASALVDRDTAYVASDSMPMVVAATHDGGTSWEASTIDAPHAANAPTFAFQAPDRGFATFHDRAQPDRLWVFSTTDGGRSWAGPRAGSLPDQPDAFPKLEPPSGGVFSLVSGKADNRPFNNRFTLSTDGGVTWNAASFPIGPASPKAVQKGIARIWLEPDGTIRLAVNADDRGSLWVSHDDGATWALVRAMPRDVPFGNMVFVTPTTWVTTTNGTDRIHTTDDAGAHWRMTTIAAGGGPRVQDVSFASGTVGWGIQHCGLTFKPGPGCEGTDGQSYLMRTLDSGATWSNVGGAAPAPTPKPTPPPGGAVWVDAGSMTSGSAGVSGPGLPTVRLDDGRVLVAGSDAAFVFDPGRGVWTPTGHLVNVRDGALAVKLADGRVLLAGGISAKGSTQKSTELFDPSTGQWRPGPSMHGARAYLQGVLLHDGRVLVVSNVEADDLSAEVYDPATRRWSPTGAPQLLGYGGGPLVVLGDGRVLMAGGNDQAERPSSIVQAYDPATGRWTVTGDMTEPRTGASAVLLRDGRVLVIGGAQTFAGRELPTAELFDPLTGAWTRTASMTTARTNRTVALLADGRVLVPGGGDVSAGTMGAGATAEVYDPATGAWKPTASLLAARWGASAVTLGDGSVLVVGGHATGSFNFLARAERFYPDGAPTH